ncbi:MAG: efflux RND transporter periplasmic adaptor subunit [Gemmatimonas sp.]
MTRSRTMFTRRPPITRTISLTMFAAAVSVSACKKKAEAPTDPATIVQDVGPENIAIVRNDTLRTGPQVTGELKPEREARLRAEVSGRVLQTMAEQGQRVDEGMLIGRIDDAAVNDQAASAKSAVTQAQVAVDQANHELARAKTLLAAGAIAERDREAAERASVGAEAQLADAKARLSTAEKNIRNTLIKAPFSGVVSERPVSAGDVVSPGTALFSIVDPTSLRLEGNIPADAIGSIRVGAPVMFTVTGYPGRTFEGKVLRINPTADATTRQVKVYVTVPNGSGKLVSGLFAKGSVATETRVGLMVPEKAVDQSGVSKVVTRLRGGKVEKVEVTVGLHDAATESFEITKGLAIGDTVLLAQAQGISAGTLVRVSAPKDASRP